MTLHDFLDDLAARGVVLGRTPGGKLRVEAPPGALTLAERKELAEKRDAVLDALAGRTLASLLPLWARLLGTLPISPEQAARNLTDFPPGDAEIDADTAELREALAAVDQDCGAALDRLVDLGVLVRDGDGRLAPP